MKMTKVLWRARFVRYVWLRSWSWLRAVAADWREFHRELTRLRTDDEIVDEWW